MSKVIEIQGKKYQLVHAVDTPQGKKTDSCGNCAFRTSKVPYGCVPSDSFYQNMVNDGAWCDCNHPCHEELMINGRYPHFKELK